MKNTSPSVTSIRMIGVGPRKIISPNEVSTIAPASLVTTPAWNVNQATTPVSATAPAM